MGEVSTETEETVSRNMECEDNVTIWKVRKSKQGDGNKWNGRYRTKWSQVVMERRNRNVTTRSSHIESMPTSIYNDEDTERININI